MYHLDGLRRGLRGKNVLLPGDHKDMKFQPATILALLWLCRDTHPVKDSGREWPSYEVPFRTSSSRLSTPAFVEFQLEKSIGGLSISTSSSSLKI
jgi:hypothetical protein